MTEVPPADQAPPEAPARERGARRAAIRRWVKRGVLAVAVIVAVIVVTFFTVDLGRISIGGRSLKSVAEQQGTKFLKRPLHIGRISALVWDGAFAFDDLVIEGPRPDLRPFFAAKRITVKIPWWNLLRRDLYLDVTLKNWRMVVENWPDGAHLPKLKPDGPGGNGPKFNQRYVAVYARDGEFIFDDHANNWSVIAPNLNFALVRATNLGTFFGTAEFSDGRTRIQKYQPMKTKFKTWFQLSGGTVKLRHIDLETDGMKSHVNGFVNFARWPEQEYRITSEVDFPTMKRIFFEKEPWRLSGQGQFAGVFKFFKDGRDLSGTFSSDEAGLGIGNSEWRFPKLHGALSWTPKSFVVSHADSDFMGGSMRLNYSLSPLGTKEGASATLTATYQDVDLYRFTRQVGFTSLEPEGFMRGQVSMGWRNGKFSETMQGTGDTVIVAPPGTTTASATLPPGVEVTPEPGEFQKYKSLGPFQLAGDMRYRFSASTLDFDPGWASTPSTYVSFSGHARGNSVNVPFHVTSHDWQKSDRLFAAIMNNFNPNSQMGAIEVGGRGTFDGVLTKEFRAPRIEGRFSGDQMRAFKVLWGPGTGDIVVENNYLNLTNGRVEYGAGDGRIIIPSGKFALGYPRADGGEEINAGIRVENMPMKPLKEAFTLTDWPVEGTVELAEMTLTGHYERPAGAGQMKIVNGTAWEEPFDLVTGRLDFKGDGSLEVNEMKMSKSGGEIRGNAVVDWADNTYGFHAETEGPGIPMQALKNFEIEQAPLTGQLTFVADGAGDFDAPTWTIAGNIQDLYAGGEGIGPVRARLTMAGDVLKIEELVADSDRLHVFGGGTIRMNDARDANLTFTVANTSIDPYLKYFARDFPYSKAVVGGTITAVGPLMVPKELSVKVTATTANLTLFAHLIQNDGDLVLSFDKNVFTLDRVVLKGVDTSLTMSGTIDLTKRVSDLKANGQASLAVLSAFYPALNASGEAKLVATLTGDLDNPSLLGQATITAGRLKHEALPQSFTDINGPIVMTEGRISVDGLKASLGEGDVQFFGGIRLDGFQPVEYDLRAEGTGMTLRYPEGLTSSVNARLAMSGPLTSPLLSGDVDVYHANYSMRVDPTRGYLGLVAGGTGAGDAGVALPAPISETPIRLDIRVKSDVVPFIENKDAEISGSADVQIFGTFDRPVVTGRVELDRGSWSFGGYRYRLQSGSIDFSNPAQLEPFFDVAAFTRVRATGQSYEITLRLSGSIQRGLRLTVSSEPYLPDFQIFSLLLGDTSDASMAELRARTASQQQQNDAMARAAAVFLTSPISGTIGSVVERATFIDTVQIVPLIGSDTTLQQNPTARVTLGQRISSRLYLTYARTLTGRQTDINEIILVEFDQNDQVSWILSRNEDRSFGLDFRIKYVFK